MTSYRYWLVNITDWHQVGLNDYSELDAYARYLGLKDEDVALFRAYTLMGPSDRPFSFNGRTFMLSTTKDAGCPVLTKSAMAKGGPKRAKARPDLDIERRVAQKFDDFNLDTGRDIGDYVIHEDAVCEVDKDSWFVEIWCVAVNIMDDYDAGYLDWKIPINRFLSPDYGWDELESDMTYTYDAGVTDTYAENGFWEDNNRKPARVSGQRKPATKGKAKGPASSKCVKKKTAGKTTDTKPKSKPKQGSSQRKPAQRRRR